jgi:hypothetical protein
MLGRMSRCACAVHSLHCTLYTAPSSTICAADYVVPFVLQTVSYFTPQLFTNDIYMAPTSWQRMRGYCRVMPTIAALLLCVGVCNVKRCAVLLLCARRCNVRRRAAALWLWGNQHPALWSNQHPAGCCCQPVSSHLGQELNVLCRVELPQLCREGFEGALHGTQTHTQ